MSVTLLFVLCSLGIAMTVQAQDCSTPVRGPHMDLKGNDITLESFPDGTKVTFACDVGYMSVGGSPSITCTAGSWSPVQLRCEIKNCGSAGQVTNGDVEYPDGTDFGAKAVVVCKTGYTSVGRGEVICSDQGWMGRLPICEVTTCPPPPVVPNATLIPSKEDYQFREVIQYTCQNELVLNGSGSLTCSQDGKFQPDPPTCVSVKCPNPDSLDRNTEWSRGARPPYKHKSSVTLQCRSGYIMRGSPHLTCEINSQWSPQPPVCELPSTTPTTTTTTTPRTTKIPPTKTPKDDANDVPRTVGIVFGVLICVAVITICGCYCFGVPGFIKRKRGDRRDKEAPHDGEDVALS